MRGFLQILLWHVSYQMQSIIAYIAINPLVLSISAHFWVQIQIHNECLFGQNVMGSFYYFLHFLCMLDKSIKLSPNIDLWILLGNCKMIPSFASNDQFVFVLCLGLIVVQLITPCFYLIYHCCCHVVVFTYNLCVLKQHLTSCPVMSLLPQLSGSTSQPQSIPSTLTFSPAKIYYQMRQHLQDCTCLLFSRFDAYGAIMSL